MNITLSKQGRVSVVNLNGNFDIASSKPFDEELSALIDAGGKWVLLDFSEVSYVASTGLRMLLKAAQRLKDDQGLLHLCCVNETVLEVFEMTGFDAILSIFDTKEQALVDLQ